MSKTARRLGGGPRGSDSPGDTRLDRAHVLWRRGRLSPAFQLMALLAEEGESIAQSSLGYFYANGLATPKDEEKAILWWRRAYARGDAAAAHNIGTIFRDRRDFSNAIRWFKKSIAAGMEGSGLEIAKIYLKEGRQVNQINKYLQAVRESPEASEAERDEAARLARRVARMKASPPRTSSKTRRRATLSRRR